MQKSCIDRATVVTLTALLALGAAGCSASTDDTDSGASSAGRSGSGGSGTAGAAGSTASAGAASGGLPGSGAASSGGTTAGAGTGAGGGAGNTTAGTTSGGSPSCEPSAIGGAAPSDQEPGTWVDVTTPEMGLTESEEGIETAVVDPARPSDIYVTTDKKGVFKSTDYGCTFGKVNTGENGDTVGGSRAVYAAIDPDTCRDPNTPLTIYVTGMFGPGGIWKSTNGGVDWIDAWENNIYLPDGTTNISSDVGGDVAEVFTIGSKDHLVASLHSYGGSGDNNGVFESTDGGGKWIVRKSETFQFQPHADILYPFTDNIWMVFPAIGSSSNKMHRTTDAGVTWTDPGDAPTISLGRCVTRVGSIFYSGSDIGGVWKSTDEGLTWTDIPGSGGQLGWVVATATQLYGADGHFTTPTFRHASLDDDQTWTTDPTPPGLDDANWDAKATFDGTHWVIIAPQRTAGLWRYVEP